MAQVLELIKAELAAAEAELRAHMASWEYAFAMGSSVDGGRDHPTHRRTREHTEQLVMRCRNLRARLAEHEVEVAALRKRSAARWLLPGAMGSPIEVSGRRVQATMSSAFRQTARLR